MKHLTDQNELWEKSKTVKFNSDRAGLSIVMSALNEVSRNPKDFFVLLEPTGAHYGYTIMKLLIERGYNVF